ncbi:MAG: hypothetical protein ACYCSJ_02195 [Acidimicrobiales bacterium]
MRKSRWINNTQPQTLQVAVILLYLNAAFTLLGFGTGGLLPLRLLLVAAEVGGGYGVANERKWGYGVAIVAAVIPLVLLVQLSGGAIFGQLLLSLMIQVALIALLLHPHSRSYQRIWFK